MSIFKTVRFVKYRNVELEIEKMNRYRVLQIPTRVVDISIF